MPEGRVVGAFTASLVEEDSGGPTRTEGLDIVGAVDVVVVVVRLARLLEVMTVVDVERDVARPVPVVPCPLIDNTINAIILMLLCIYLRKPLNHGIPIFCLPFIVERLEFLISSIFTAMQ